MTRLLGLRRMYVGVKFELKRSSSLAQMNANLHRFSGYVTQKRAIINSHVSHQYTQVARLS